MHSVDDDGDLIHSTFPEHGDLSSEDAGDRYLHVKQW